MLRLLLPVLLMALTPAGAMASGDLPVDPVLRGLQQADAAEANGDYDGLSQVARTLDVLGAHPADGQEDLTTRWIQKVAHLGAHQSVPEYRGRALGPAYRRAAIVPGGSLTMRQLFLGGQRARISVAPARGAANLSIRVQGGDGGILCAKPIDGPQADCAWMPVFTDRFDIVIENGGSEPATFYMVVR